MKRNKIMDEIRKTIKPEIRKKVEISFDIADRIYAILKKKNITQREFAKRMGKKESEISKWLSGSHNFTIQTLVQIQTNLDDDIIEIIKPFETQRTAIYKETLKYNQVFIILPEHVQAPIEPVNREWRNSLQLVMKTSCEIGKFN